MSSNSSNTESTYSPSSSSTSPSSGSSCSVPFEEAFAWNLPHRSPKPAKPQSSFLFIDYQEEKSQNKKLRYEKHGFLLKNYHRRRKQASIQRLKTQTTAPTDRLLVNHSTNKQSTADKADSTREHDRWVVDADISRRAPGQAALRSEMWSLRAFLSQGSVDPFSASAVTMSDSMNMYFHHFRIHTIAACYPVDATRMSIWWWQKAITQPALLQALLFLTAGHQATLESSNGVSSLVVKKSMQDSLHLRGGTLKMLNNIMQDPLKAVAESTTLVVASLVAIEAVDANIEAHNAHMKGLKRLVQLIGGLDNLDHMTQSKIYQSDVKSAALYNTRPVFPISASWRSEIIQDVRLFLTQDELDTPEDLTYLGVTIFSSSWYTMLDYTMKTSLYVIRRLIIYYEYAQRNPASVMPTDNDLFLIAEHQLLSACYETTDPADINESLRLTLVIYLNLRVWHFQSFPFMQYVVESLRQSLNIPYLYLQTETPELLFWVLVLGSLASQGYKCHRWYLSRLIEMTEQLGLNKWEEARAILGGYFYTDQTSEKRAEEDLWNEVLLKETYSYIAPKPA